MMTNLAFKNDPSRVFQELGTVIRVEGPTLLVETTAGKYKASRATSCLVAPEVGDQVLVAALEDGTAYVLAILQREAGQVTAIEVDGDLAFQLPCGSFTVAAQDGVHLVSGKDVDVVAGGLSVNAVRGTFVIEQLSFVGTMFQATVEKAKLVAVTLDSVLERWSQRVTRSYRFVEEIDRVQAGQVDYSAKKTMSLHARNAMVTAEELVKLDGEQIHVG